jgi:opacity protein-like surface antigen
MRTLAFFLFSAALACAQSAQTDAGEVAAYAGGAFGIGSHPATGMTFATALSKYVLFGAELGFAPLGTESFQGRIGSGFTRARLYDFNGHVQVRIPVRDNWAPYITVGPGLLHSTAERVSSTALGNNVVKTSDNAFAFHIGAGLRYYFTNNWGVRPEWKFYASDRNFSKLVVGAFYQFP